jgi:hypothetical protein
MSYPLFRKCGASHGMSMENMETGEIEPLDICRDCLFTVNSQSVFSPHLTLEDLNEWEKRLQSWKND